MALGASYFTIDNQYQQTLVSLALPHCSPHECSCTRCQRSENGQSGDLIEKVRHVLGEAKGDGVKTDGNEQNADDTAIVQSVGAPFAALQWREEDSLNNFRCGHAE